MDLVFLLSVIYFYLPGAIANIGANLARFIPFFKRINAPIDGGKKLYSHRLVGEHKTWGGFFCGLLFGVVFGMVKYFIVDKYWFGTLFLRLDLDGEMVLVFILSFGALFGDIVKSVIKRLLGIQPHDAWIPFDEIDHTLMAMLLVKLFFGVEWKLVFWVIGVFFVLHWIANVVGYKLKIKRVPY